MRPTDKIKQYLKNVPIKTNPKVNQTVLDDLLDRLDAAQGAKERSPQPNTWRIIMKNRITKLSAAAVILIAAAVILSQVVFTGVTFADVVKPLLEAKTIVFDMILGSETEGVVIHDRVSGSRIRRTMSNMKDLTMIIDLDNKKMLALDSASKGAAYVDIEGPLQEGTRDFLKFIRDTIVQLQSDPNLEARKQSGRLDGRKVLVFSLGNEADQVMVYADPDTALPIRLELKTADQSYIIKNFEFNIPIDPSEVSMEVPAGYQQQEAQLDLSNVTEKDLVESLQIWASVLRDGTFPDQLSTQEYMAQIPLMEQKYIEKKVPVALGENPGFEFVQGMMFIQTFQIKGMEPWHYAGAGVKLGDASKAIFWYRPKESQTYRVIYGDLSVKDIAEKDLPK